MLFEIKNRFNALLLFKLETTSLRLCLEAAVTSGADLRGAVLRDAVLRGADLRDADLGRADLGGADLPAGYRIARLDFGGWPVTITPIKTAIGCQEHPNSKWLKADKRWIAALDENAATWWKQHGVAVKAVIRDIMKKVKP